MLTTTPTAPQCSTGHRRAVAMVHVGTTQVPALRIEHYECPRCGRARRIEVALFDQPTLFDD